MSERKDFIEMNQECWNRRTDIHVASAFYDMEGFKAGRSSLNGFERALLGDGGGPDQWTSRVVYRNWAMWGVSSGYAEAKQGMDWSGGLLLWEEWL
jgi:hypothetical protein